MRRSSPIRPAALALLLVGAAASAQEPALVEQPFEMALGEGSAPVELTIAAESDGGVCVWARSDDFDPRLELVAADGRVRARDEDSGGGTVAAVSAEVAAGEVLRVRLARSPEGAPGTATVHVALTVETPATRALAAEAPARQAEIERLWNSGERDEARRELTLWLDELLAVPGAERSALVMLAAWRLGFPAFHLLRDLPAAERAWGTVLEHFQRTLPEQHAHLQWGRGNTALALKQQGFVEPALALEELVLAARESTLPEDHADLQIARVNLAASYAMTGEEVRAAALEQQALDVYDRTLAPDDPTLQTARLNHAITLARLGHYQEAYELAMLAHSVLLEVLPPDHHELLRAHGLAGMCLENVGEPERALEFRRHVLEACERTLPADHPDLQFARVNASSSLAVLGRLDEARDLIELALAAHREQPVFDPIKACTALDGLALCLFDLGDHERALVLQEQALAELSELLPPEHLSVQGARSNLARTLSWLGHDERAAELQAEAYAIAVRTLPESHALRQLLTMNRAHELVASGELDEALELARLAVELYERHSPPENPDVQRARLVLARALHLLGRMDEARAGLEGVIATLAEVLPLDHPLALGARVDLSLVLDDLGDEAAATARAAQLAEILRAGARDRALVLAPREVEEWARSVASSVDVVLTAGPELDDEAFALIETVRALGVLAARAGAVGSSEQRTELRRAGARVARLARDAHAREGELAEAVGQRDRLWRALAAAARADQGAPELPVLDAASLAQRLGPRELSVSYWTYRRARLGGDPGRPELETRVVAFLLTPAGELERVELGPLAPIETAVGEWSAALGASLGARGVGVAEESSEGAVREAGSALRALVLDPLGPRFVEAERVRVLPDGVLHLVPLETLPEGEALVGDARAIEVRASSWELLLPRTRDGGAPGDGRLVAVGGVEYGANEGSAAPFAPLPGTVREVERIATLHAREDDRVLAGASATGAALRALAPEARYLHLATHGFFAPDALARASEVRVLDADLGLARVGSGARQVVGLSPMALCGLALAPSESEGSVLTAEELATWPLDGCELAVLSACDTSVGRLRAGQGVASLQRALHLAGARTVVTSLWKVPDEATMELMADFYGRMWVDGVPPAQALWEAKRRLRAARDEHGHPRYSLRDWGAWVLTGEPD